ncbi:MAG TPA: flagellar hook-basal body complex protein, partial [Gallionella sp.]|nr:flagellar hook-basal body complex protein [Gallionella sp.]
ISGQGFFRLVDNSGTVMYSRNGQFQVNKNGYIVNAQGNKVTGYLPNGAGAIVPSAPAPIQISAINLAPQQTANSVVGVNLDSLGAVPTVPGFNPNNPSTYNNSTSMTVYDSLGGSHLASLYFQRLPVAPTTSASIIAAGSTSVTVASAAGLAVGNTITIPGAGPAGPSTTVVGAGTTTTATVASATGLTVGDNITVGALGTATITGIAGNVLTFAPALGGAPVGGETISSTTPETATITAIAGNVLTFSPATSSNTLANAAISSNAGSGNWNTYMTLDGVSVPPLTPPATALTPLATLSFNTLGQLTSPVGPPLGQIASATFTPAGAATQSVTFQFGQTTQYGGTFGVNSLTQDGYATGQLTGFTTSPDGTIIGSYSNSQTRPLGQMVLANFTDPQGLQPVNNNNWVETAASGGPLVGTPGSSSLGVLQSSATENSNVDLTSELVNMITAQRNYQANAQSIKTQDQNMQTLMSLR